MLDLLVVGDANPDVVVSGAPETPPAGQAETLVESGTLALGGSAAIVAHGAARLGLRTGLAAMVGRDAAGDFVLDTLTAAGVDITACERHDTLPTALTVCLNRPGGDRAILTAPGCLPAYTPKALGRARHLHAASYFLQPRLAADLPRLFAMAREAGATTSLDTNDDPSGDWRLAEGLLDVCDFLLPNEGEALRLSGHADLDEALAALAGSGRTAVVKRGAAGALARRGEKLWEVRPAPSYSKAGAVPVRGPVEVADTVGAGDSFDAGFIAGWLTTGSLPAALALAAACGTLSTRAVGGTAAQPGREEAERLARTLITDAHFPA